MIKKENITLDKLCAIYITAYFACQFANFIPIFSILIVGLCVVAIYLTSGLRQKLLYSILNPGFISGLLFVVFSLLIYYANEISSQYYYSIDNMIKICILYMFYIYLKNCEKKFLRVLLIIALVGYFTTMMSTMINAILDPNAIRFTASREVSSRILLGFGGYDFIYGMIVVNIVLVWHLTEKTIYKNKSFYIIFVILNSFTIITSAFSTAIILNFIFILLTCFHKKRHIVILPFIAIISSFIPQVITKLIINIIKLKIIPELVERKLLELVNGLLRNGRIEYFDNPVERGHRFLQSLDLIKEHPVLGNFIGNPTAIYGGHTEWIDRLAQYGVLMCILIMIFWIQLYKNEKQYLKYKEKKISVLNISFLYFIILGFLNPNSFIQTVFPIMFFVPFFDELFFRGRNEHIDN